MFIEKELSGAQLSQQLSHLLSNREELQTMGKAMQECAFPAATEKIVDECLRCLKTYSA